MDISSEWEQTICTHEVSERFIYQSQHFPEHCSL